MLNLARLLTVVLLATGVAAVAASAQAPTLKPNTFPSFRPSFAETGPSLPVPRPAGERVRNAAIGGVFGAVAGVATCTILSLTLFGGTGCTPKGNLQFGVGGFLLGAGIGAVL